MPDFIKKWAEAPFEFQETGAFAFGVKRNTVCPNSLHSLPPEIAVSNE